MSNLMNNLTDQLIGDLVKSSMKVTAKRIMMKTTTNPERLVLKVAKLSAKKLLQEPTKAMLISSENINARMLGTHLLRMDRF